MNCESCVRLLTNQVMWNFALGCFLVFAINGVNAHERLNCEKTEAFKALENSIYRVMERASYECRRRLKTVPENRGDKTQSPCEMKDWRSLARIEAHDRAHDTDIEMCKPPILLQPIGDYVEGELPPQYPFKLESHCTTEYGCYGTFPAEADIPIYKRERDRSEVVAVIPPGKEFTALDGNLWVLTPFVVIARYDTYVSPINQLLFKSTSHAVFRPGRYSYEPRVYADKAVIRVKAGERLHIIESAGAESPMMLAIYKGQQVTVDWRDYSARLLGGFRFTPEEQVLQRPCIEAFDLAGISEEVLAIERAHLQEVGSDDWAELRRIRCAKGSETEFWAKVRFGDIEGWIDFGNAKYFYDPG